MSFGRYPFGHAPFGAQPSQANLDPTSIASAEAFGTASVGHVISPTSIAGAEAFGTATLVALVDPSSIASAEAFGTASIGHVIEPESITDSGVFGIPRIFDTTPGGFTREPAVVVEIDQDFCQQEAYGVGTCTAGRIFTGFAQGGSSLAIDLDTSANPEDDAYNGMTVRIVAGTGEGQERRILDYYGTTGAAVVSRGASLRITGVSPSGVNFGNIANRSASQMSVEMWILPTGTPHYVGLASNWVANGWLFTWAGSGSGRMVWGIGDASSVQHVVQSDSVLSNVAPSHVVGTYDGTTLRLYVNGVLQADTEAFSTPTISTSANVFCTNRDAATTDVIVDGARLYNRGLSAAEVLDRFNGIPVESGLIAAWEFDEATGSTVTDTSGAENAAGVISGTTAWNAQLAPSVVDTGEAWEVEPDGTSEVHIINRPSACFHTFKSCQDTDNFINGTKTIYWCKPQQRLPLMLSAAEDVVIIPSLVEVTQTPSRINAGGSMKNSSALGTRGSVAVTFMDHPSSDLQLDPYVADRLYDPLERGTWWTKWNARNPYFEGREMRVRNGRIGQLLSDMSTLYYILERVVGPNAGGTVQVGATDRLRLLDDERAQCPRLSKGSLNANIDISQATITVEGTTIAEDYESSSGTIRIGDEVITYTGISESLGVITFTGCTRAQDNTEADEHEENDLVQRCVRFTDERPVDVIYALANEWGELEDRYLDYHPGWTDESDTWLVGFTVSTLLTEPTGVKQLIGELCEQVQLFVWWDEKEQLVRLAALRAPTIVPDEVNEQEHILLGSHSFHLDPNQRITELWVYYARIDPTKSLDDENNYAQARVKIDAPAEGINQYNGVKVRRIFSRWLTNATHVNDVQTRMLARYRDTPLVGSLMLDSKDRGRWWTGDLINVRTRLLGDFTGAPTSRQFQVIAAQEELGGERFKLDLQNYELLALRQARYMAASAPDYSSASALEKVTGAWYSDDFGKLGDDEGYFYQ